MTYREEICIKITEALRHAPVEEIAFEKMVRAVYAKGLEEAKKTGASVEHLTYEILEGIEESLSEFPEQVEPVLEHASQLMADLVHYSAEEDIRRKYQRITFAKEALHETVEAEKMHLQESMSAFKSYAAEHQHRHFMRTLESIGAEMMRHMRKLAGEIMYNHKQT